MKTASRILGTAFFLEGYEVQDAPRYGAERRGAPIFAYVRASREPIQERGVIARPDLVVVADDTLVPVPAAGVLAGITARTVVLISSHIGGAEWRRRLNLVAPLVILPPQEDVTDRAEQRYAGASCAGAAARLVGVIGAVNLEKAVRSELAGLGSAVVEKNIVKASNAYIKAAGSGVAVSEGEPVRFDRRRLPDWVRLDFEEAQVSAPAIHGALTSGQARTGLWRMLRPVIDQSRCSRCWWVCSTFCPDGAIAVSADGSPRIDYDHCKGCMICVAQCPPHAIEAIPEHPAWASEQKTSGDGP